MKKKKAIKKTKTPVKRKKKKRRKKKKKILIPRIIRFARTQLAEMYGLPVKIKRAKGYKLESKAHIITMYSPTKLYLGEVGLHKTDLANKKVWVVFSSKSGMFCGGGKIDQVLRFIKGKVLEEFKGKCL